MEKDIKKTYQEIRDKKQKDYNDLFTNCGVFWAFSNEQFKEGYQKVKPTMAEGEKLVDIGAGGYIPKHNVEALKAGTKAIEATFKAQIAENNAREQHILYELNNHECFHTGSIDEAIEALGEDYTAEEVEQVRKKYKTAQKRLS